MAYLANKPQATDLLSQSQIDIQGNFSTANTNYGINHYPFDDGTVNVGKHKHVSLPPQLASPPTAFRSKS